MRGKHPLASLFALGLAIVAISSIPDLALGSVFSMPAGQTSLQFVTIGDPGNAADGTGLGAVSYTYSMGEFDVTAAQYVQFLNAVAQTDPYSVYNSSMSSSSAHLGLTRSGASGSYVYAVAAANENFPMVDVTWGDVARFANWLTNGQPSGAESGSTTETGSYALNGAVTATALDAITRSVTAQYVIPTESEWYKAAFYKGGGTHVGYWKYATGTSMAPSNVLLATGTDNANFYSSGYTDPMNKLTSVGAFTDSPSPYGTFDQDGDVFNWNENNNSPKTDRYLQGAPYENGYSSFLAAGQTDDEIPTTISNLFGFRIAELSVPEPTSMSLVIWGSMCFLTRRRTGQRGSAHHASQPAGA
jgi:hypothetical protein